MTALNGINQVDLGAREQIEALKEKISYPDPNEDNGIYGLSVDFANNKFTRLRDSVNKNGGEDFNNCAPWKRRRCNLTMDGVVLAYYGESDYEEGEEGRTTKIIEKNGTVYPIGTIIQTMVEQPKFYYKIINTKKSKLYQYQEYYVACGYYATAETAGVFTLNAGDEIVTSSFAIGESIRGIFRDLFSKLKTWETLQTNDGAVTMYLLTSIPIYARGAPYFDYTGNFSSNPMPTVQNKASFYDKGLRTIEGSEYYVSNKKYIDFKVHPLFLKNGIEVDNIYLSAYETTSESDRAVSLPNKAIMIKGLSSWREKVLQDNWTISNLDAISATQLLFLIEYATFDSQKIMGYGIDYKNTNYKTGETSALGNKTTIKLSEGFASVSYRGEENLFGGIATIIESTRIIDDLYGINLYVQNRGTMPSDDLNSYYSLSLPLLKRDYIGRFGIPNKSDIFFIPVTGNASSTEPVGDAQVIDLPRVWPWSNYKNWYLGLYGSDYSYKETGLFSYVKLVSGTCRLTYTPK